MFIFWTTTLVLLWVNVDSIIIGSITNASYVPINSTFSLNISTNSCEQCFCAALAQNLKFEAMNCIQNSSCLFYTNYSTNYIIQRTNNTVLYFFRLPPSPKTTQTTSTSTVTTAIIDSSSFWSFDNNTFDSLSNYNGIPVNSPIYRSPGINAYGTALSFNASNNQSVEIPTYRNLVARSFTIEMWFYSTDLTNYDNGLFGQSSSYTQDYTLHCTIRNSVMYFGFFNDDLSGSTVIQINNWYHVAFVFDNSSCTKKIYLNGVLDASQISSSYYQGSNGSIVIGKANLLYACYFSGYIDQVSLVMRAKNVSEILIDATLVSYHSFDNASYSDSGPLSLQVTVGNVSSVSGRVNQALSFTSNASFYQINGFVLLGVPYSSYSMALWTYPSSIRGSVLVHSSTTTDGNGWCVDFIGFSSIGQIVVTGWEPPFNVEIIGPILPSNAWTYVAVTYSPTNAMRLYINGTLYNSSSSFSYLASGGVNILTLGSPLGGIQSSANGPCNSQLIVPDVYNGYIDEFRVYSRELNASDVQALANP